MRSYGWAGLLKEASETQTRLLGKAATHKPRGEAAEESNLTDTLILDFYPPD